MITLDEFRELARTHRVIPVARRVLAEELTPTGVYRRFGGAPGSFILESAEHGQWDRWSFVGIRSRATLLSMDGTAQWLGDVPAGLPDGGDILDVMRETMRILATAPLAGYPPLTGGMVGALGWDFIRSWEKVPGVARDDLGHPRVALCLVDDMIAIDHATGEAWLIANAINADGSDERVDEAYAACLERIDAMQCDLAEPCGAMLNDVERVQATDLVATMTPSEYENAVLAGKAAIRDGEVFQVVLSLRLDVPSEADPLDVYRALRHVNPSPYMYLVRLPRPDGGTWDVVGSSPETLVKVTDGHAMTFPIAGSRPRGASPEQDSELASELLADEKERAEHLMLVDLSRNDMAKICDPATVVVREFMDIKRYSHIMHLASTVTGTMRPGKGAVDAIVATFPAGTLSGAPKVRAIELIDQIEPTRRGIYGGTVGYLDFAGNLDMAIAIRTAVLADGRATVQSGAGIVADSVPATEYIETVNKAAAAASSVVRVETWT